MVKIVPVSRNDEFNKLAVKVAQQFVWRSNYRKPAFDRMDYHMAMYQLEDLVQQSKPAGFAKFISNDPMTAVDTAQSILTRNDTFWDSDLLDIPGADVEEREKVSHIEAAMGGIVHDFDMLLTSRGEPRFWKQAAWYALLRGWVWSKFLVTEDSGRDDGVPFQGEFKDPRGALPLFDGGGLHSVLFGTEISLAQLLSDYPDNEELQRLAGDDEYDLDLSQRVYKIEWWDFRTYKMTGVLAAWPGDTGSYSFHLSWAQGSKFPMRGTWVQEPFLHGYDSVTSPIVGVPVNGLPMKTRPPIPQSIQASLAERASLHHFRLPTWHGVNGHVADQGRSILAAVEEAVPQFNEIVASVLHQYAKEAYDTLFIHTRTGDLPPLQFGAGAVNPLRLEERVDRMNANPVSSDAYRLLGILSEEKQRGILSNILQATTQFQGPAFLFAQVGEIALNALEPFKDGMQTFGTHFARSMMQQLAVAKVGTLDLVARARNRTYVSISFDPATALEDRQYLLVPRFEPALPDDLAIKAQTARLLLDPRNPVMSLETVLQRVFNHPDAAGEQDRIWANVANTDPLIVLMRIAKALRDEGLDELADEIEAQKFAMAFVRHMQQAQLTGGQLPGGQQTSAGAGLGPEAGGTGAPGMAQEGVPTEPAGVDNAPSQTGAQA